MFTLADVRNIAVQIEQNGEATYRLAANQTTDSQLKKMLLWMAEEEKQHGEQFNRIIVDKPLTAEQAELEAMGRSLLQDIVRSQTFSLEQQRLGEALNIEELLYQSIEFENDTIDFYEFLAGFLDDTEAIAQMQAIIEQERGHVQNLEQVLNIATPSAAHAVKPELMP